MQKAEIVAKEKNRASAVAMNAEIRRTKARLAEEVPKLQRLAVKRVSFLFSSWITYIAFLLVTSSLFELLLYDSCLNFIKGCKYSLKSCLEDGSYCLRLTTSCLKD